MQYATLAVLVGLASRMAMAKPTPVEVAPAAASSTVDETIPLSRISHVKIKYCTGIHEGVGCTGTCLEYDKWAEGIAAPGAQWNWMNYITCVKSDKSAAVKFTVCDKNKKGELDHETCKGSETLHHFDVDGKRYFETHPEGKVHFLFIHHSDVPEEVEE